MIIIAINDIKATYSDGKIFKECRVMVRKGFEPITKKKVKLSELENISISKDKNGFLCYCDGYKNIFYIGEVPKVFIDEVQIIGNGTVKLEDGSKISLTDLSESINNKKEYNNPIDEVTTIVNFKEIKVTISPDQKSSEVEVITEERKLEDTFIQENPYEPNEYISLEEVVHRTPIQDYDHNEELDHVYQADKLWWILKFSNDKRLKLAAKEHYSCDDEYVRQRIEVDFPGFEVSLHNTYFLAAKYPSYTALLVEQYFKNKLLENKKYKMRTRIGYLEQHGNTIYEEPKETLIIFNYLNNYEIFCPIELLFESCIDKLEHEVDG